MSAVRSCEPARRCSKSNRETGTKESVRLLNIYLDELEKKVEEAHTQLIKERKEITTVSLKNKFLGKEEQKPMLLDILKKGSMTFWEGNTMFVEKKALRIVSKDIVCNIN